MDYSNYNKSDDKRGKNLFRNVSKVETYVRQSIVSRLFWGRGNLYKNVIHLFMIVITIAVAISGISSRIYSSNNVVLGDNVVGSTDLLFQGASIETVLTSQNGSITGGISTITHRVAPGDSLDSIADLYKITKDTIKWFNPDLLAPFSDNIQVGWDLKIPAPNGIPINGVLYTVRAGQSIDDVVNITSQGNEEANKFNIVEFNSLSEPYTLTEGQKLFIPDGNLSLNVVTIDGIPKGAFINPLSHPSCSGYSYSRGFTYYHNGVDLAKWPGCTIVAMASGVIEYAGWQTDGGGFSVRIDHGGAVKTYYNHGDGRYYVKTGDRVIQGQAIMEMGTTGNSTGVHLHFSVLKNGAYIDPESVVNVW